MQDGGNVNGPRKRNEINTIKSYDNKAAMIGQGTQKSHNGVIM